MQLGKKCFVFFHRVYRILVVEFADWTFSGRFPTSRRGNNNVKVLNKTEIESAP